MSAEPKVKITPREYLRRERLAEHKCEYFNGEIFAMAGSSPRHVRINSRLGVLLGRAFEGGPCYPLSSDLKERVPPTGPYTHPDQIVLCDEMRSPLINI
jgi:Uma2 family endonuclease